MDKAAEVRDAVLGTDGSASADDDTPFNSEFRNFVRGLAFGEVWSRPGLALEKRRLLTIGILLGLGREAEMEKHFGAALKNGMTIDELKELLIHAVPYAGIPMTIGAQRAAERAVAKFLHTA